MLKPYKGYDQLIGPVARYQAALFLSHLSPKSISELTNISYRTMCRLLNGEREIRNDELDKIAEVFGVRSEFLKGSITTKKLTELEKTINDISLLFTKVWDIQAIHERRSHG